MATNMGEIVELAVRRRHINISELSRKLEVDRRTLYNWFGQKELPQSIIYKIGKAINYDFSHEFGGEFDKLNEMPIKTNDVDHNNQEQTDRAFYWMEKYIDLLEDYKKLLNKDFLIL